jgi:hypothetical protein
MSVILFNNISSLYFQPNNEIPTGLFWTFRYGNEICGLYVIPAVEVNSINLFLYDPRLASSCPQIGAEKGAVGNNAINPSGKEFSISFIRFALKTVSFFYFISGYF